MASPIAEHFCFIWALRIFGSASLLLKLHHMSMILLAWNLLYNERTLCLHFEFPGSKQNPQPYPFPYPNPPINEPTQAPVPSTTRAPPATVQPNPTQSPTQPPAQTPTTPVSTPTDPCPSIVFDATTFWRGELFSFTVSWYRQVPLFRIYRKLFAEWWVYQTKVPCNHILSWLSIFVYKGSNRSC